MLPEWNSASVCVSRTERRSISCDLSTRQWLEGHSESGQGAVPEDDWLHSAICCHLSERWAGDCQELRYSRGETDKEQANSIFTFIHSNTTHEHSGNERHFFKSCYWNCQNWHIKTLFIRYLGWCCIHTPLCHYSNLLFTYYSKMVTLISGPDVKAKSTLATFAALPLDQFVNKCNQIQSICFLKLAELMHVLMMDFV